MTPSENGFEPQISGYDLEPQITGLEPRLGGVRRPRLDIEMFRGLIDIDTYTRNRAINDVLDRAMGRLYASAMIKVLQPGTRRFERGRLLKAPYAYEEKLAAIDSLIRLQPDMALSGLVTALGNNDLQLQQVIMYKIGQLEDYNADKVLDEILQDGRRNIRHAAMRSIASRWGQPVVSRLTHQMSPIVSEASQFLAEHESERILPLFLAAFRDKRPGEANNDHARSSILVAVGRIGQRLGGMCASDCVQILRYILDDRSVTVPVKKSAVDALRLIDSEEAKAVVIVYEPEFGAA